MGAVPSAIATAQFLIKPFVAPVASFTGTPTGGTVPLTVTFTDNSTGTITNRSWMFGDGGTTNTLHANVAYTYNSAGTNTVKLIVTGPSGVSTNTRTNYVIVTNTLPQQVVLPATNNYYGVIMPRPKQHAVLLGGQYRWGALDRQRDYSQRSVLDRQWFAVQRIGRWNRDCQPGVQSVGGGQHHQLCCFCEQRW